MVELRNYQIDIAEQFAKYRNNLIIFDNGYDKVPNPFTLKDAKEFITLQLKKTFTKKINILGRPIRRENWN
jgi:hypothetical protein